MTTLIDTPLVIFSFSRPEYLGRLCRSLLGQQRVILPGSLVHLLQDGAVSPRTGVRWTDDALTEECIAVFRGYFPDGQVLLAPHNLGLAMNILRGERLVFETLDRPLGYFFEDDLELGPLYLHAMEQVRIATEALPKVGYFAAYGDKDLERTGPEVTLVPLAHHWGFGLRRACWRAMMPWLRDYYTVIRGIDYQARPHLRILKLYQNRRVGAHASSQDVAKTLACADLGFARVNTDVCFARYIGEKGESFRPEQFARKGYDKARFVGDGDYIFPPVDPEEIAAIAEMQLRQHAAYRGTQYDAFMADYSQRQFDPDEPVTREQVDAVWRLLLDRLPGSEEYYEKTVGQITLRALRTGLIRSREGRGKSPYGKPPEPRSGG